MCLPLELRSIARVRESMSPWGTRRAAQESQGLDPFLEVVDTVDTVGRRQGTPLGTS